MVGHGTENNFIIKSGKVVSSTSLDLWLDFQQEQVSNCYQLIIYEACYSGSFIPVLKPENDQKRIVISSTSKKQRARFSFDGTLSFSFTFWSILNYGEILSDAFEYAKYTMLAFQKACIDSDGNGIANEKYDDQVDDFKIGKPVPSGSTPSKIHAIGIEPVIDNPDSALIWADDIVPSDNLKRVWAIIMHPDNNSSQEDDIDDIIDEIFSTYDLLDLENDGRYELIYDNFSEPGQYTINLFTLNSDNYCSYTSFVYKNIICEPDLYEDDNSIENSSIFWVNKKNQKHNFHNKDDVDWVKFQVIQGNDYEFRAENLGDDCDIEMAFFNTDGITCLPDLLSILQNSHTFYHILLLCQYKYFKWILQD